MEDAHGVVPETEHNACIVDLLGRAGRLDEAVEFINKMLNWETLLLKRFYQLNLNILLPMFFCPTLWNHGNLKMELV
ncbi:pentatricopeptide repeat-containing protein [Trifolium medium]|uniref:Pentatricopeptide repeat-containing protein n=1 Tax=Trifolium medium TaxID=97028 RepID=A0A392N476_9FABA|nr:pentatricopeptide repeat-containing protein [Trifolium medium]